MQCHITLFTDMHIIIHHGVKNILDGIMIITWEEIRTKIGAFYSLLQTIFLEQERKWLTNEQIFAIVVICESGGTGIHSRLKICRLFGLTGSNPVSRTS